MRASAKAAPPSRRASAGDLLDVGGRVAAHALGIAPVDGVDLVAADVLAIRAGDAEVPRDGLEPVTGQLAGREVVAPHGVERVDQLAARRDEADAAAVAVAGRGASARGPRAASPGGRSGRARAARRGVRARRSRNGRSKPCRLWFSMTSGSAAPDSGDEPADQVGLGRVASPSASSISARPSGRARRS